MLEEGHSGSGAVSTVRLGCSGMALLRIAYTTIGVARLIVAALSTIRIGPVLIVARVLLLIGRHAVVECVVLG